MGVTRIGRIAAAALCFAALSCSDASSTLPVDVPKAVASVVVDLGAQSLQVGQTASATVTVRDAQGNAIAGRPITWSSSNASVATVSSAGTVAAVGAGASVITATAGGVGGSITLLVTNPATSVVVNLSASTLQVGQTAAATAIARDAASNILPGRAAAWSSSAPAVVTATSSGEVRAVGQGAALVVATIDGATGSAPIVVTAAGDPTAASSLSLSSVPTLAENGVPLAQQPTVQLLNFELSPVRQSGIVVTAAIASGGGSLVGTTTATTNQEGIASFSNLAILGATGTRRLSFAAPNLPLVISGPVELLPGAATVVSVLSAPSLTAANAVRLPQQPVVQLRDQTGNAVLQAGVVVTASIASGGGTLSGATAVTGATGEAAFTDLTITGAVGDRVISFGTASSATPVSATVTVTPGVPTHLTMVTQPSATSKSGVAFAQQPVLQIRDVSGNAVSQAGAQVTAAVVSGAGAIGGTTTVATSAAGVATFTNLMVSGLIGARVLGFTAPSISGTNSLPIGITAGNAASLIVTVQPSTATASSDAFAAQPVVALVDAWNNAVTQAGVTVTASLASGSGALAGVQTSVTNASGAAFFSGLGLTGDGVYTLRFSAPSLSTATSVPITVVSPIKTVNFDAYSSTAAMIGDCQTFDCSEQMLTDNAGVTGFTAGDMTLDPAANPPGSTKAMKYHYLHPGNGCNSITLKRSIKFPARQEVWAEFQVKWSTNFTTSNVLCSPNDHKLIFGNTESDLNGRWGLYVGSDEPKRHAIRQETAHRPDTLGGNTYMNRNPKGSANELLPEALWNGKWHTIRFHIKASTTPSTPDAEWEIWIDGVLYHRHIGFKTYRHDGTSVPDRIDGFRFAANKDDGPAGIDMYLWWGRIRVFGGNPGW